MDSFLRQFQSDGTFDSRGVFTINAEKAQVKLSAYQLADFSQFPTFLLGAGTAAGARKLSISFPESGGLKKARTTKIEFAGWSLSADDLRIIGVETLKRDTPRALRYLATVISSIGHKYDFRMTSEGFVLSFRQGVLQPPQQPASGVPQNAVTIEIETDLKQQLERGFAGQEKFSPLRVHFEDKVLSTGFDPTTESSDGVAYLVRGGAGLPSISFKNASHGSVMELDGEALPPMAVGLTRADDAKRTGMWLLVEDLVYRAPRDFCPEGIFGVIVADGLQRDLSYKVVENADYLKLQELLLVAIRRLCRRFREKKLPPAKLEIVRKLCKSVGVKWLAFNSTPAKTVSPSSPTRPPTVSGNPTKNPNELGAFLASLTNVSPSRSEALIQGYHRQMERALKSGKPVETLEWTRAFIAVKHKLQLETPVERFAYQLLQLLSDSGPSQFGAIPELPEKLQQQAGYMRVLCRWWTGRGVSKQDLPTSSIHCSWLYPLGLAPDCEHPWVQLLRLDSEGRAAQALEFVKHNRHFSYAKDDLHWIQYFWSRHRGRLSWLESIKMRVFLSFASDRNPVDFSKLWYNELLERVLYLEFQQPSFWPAFLQLRAMAKEGELREIWAKALTRTFLENSLNSPDYPLLSEPLDLAYSRSGSTPSR